MYHVGGGGSGGAFWSCCCCIGPVAGFRMHHAGGNVFCPRCSSQISSPRGTCSQTKSGEMKNARSPPTGLGDCRCWVSFCLCRALMWRG